MEPRQLARVALATLHPDISRPPSRRRETKTDATLVSLAVHVNPMEWAWQWPYIGGPATLVVQPAPVRVVARYGCLMPPLGSTITNEVRKFAPVASLEELTPRGGRKVFVVGA